MLTIRFEKNLKKPVCVPFHKKNLKNKFIYKHLMGDVFV